MKIKFATLALLAAVAAAGAQASPEVGVTAPRLAAWGSDRMHDVEGYYRLTDGRVLQVGKRASQVIARLEGEATARLSGRDMQSLRSADGRMEMRFVPNRDGDDLDVVVTLYGADRKVAQVLASRQGG